MNIFEIYLDKIIKLLKSAKEEGLLELPENLSGINVDISPDKFNCDISTNAAMILSKPNKKLPMEIAKVIVDIVKKNDENVEEIKIENPGFINLKFKNSFWNNFLKSIIKDNKYGSQKKIETKKYLVEFVSANPTGPLHVGHCRGAILGDVISNLLKFNNHQVTKEYYVNDYGNQIGYFTQSVYFRIREILFKEKFPIDNKDLYPGDYLINIANNIIDQNKNIKFDNFESISNELTKLSVIESLKLIKFNLNNIGISHDNFASETDVVLNNEVDQVVEKLKKDNFVYMGKIKAPEGEGSKNWTEREQLLFKSTDFGDDKDRPLQKADQSWTYFASDVAYHNTKLKRNFDILINILGADHAGYTKRISSVVEALSGEKNKLICKVSQLVKLIKDGKPFKMSKRKGDYITVEDLIEQVGKDATRFIMLSRSNDVELDFDFEKVTEKSKDNPVFYVQYAYARINSIFRTLNLDLKSSIKLKDDKFILNEYEINILKKIAEWPKCVELSSTKFEPHRIPFYLYELVTLFHSYWNMGTENKEFRFISENNNLNSSRLILLKALSIVIKNGMSILGVSTPSKM